MVATKAIWDKGEGTRNLLATWLWGILEIQEAVCLVYQSWRCVEKYFCGVKEMEKASVGSWQALTKK